MHRGFYSNYSLLVSLALAAALFIPYGEVISASAQEAKPAIDDYYLVRFDSIPDLDDELQMSSVHGVELLEYRQDNTYLLRISDEHVEDFSGLAVVDDIAEYPTSLKVHSELYSATGTVDLRIMLHKGTDIRSVAKDLQKVGVQVGRMNTKSILYIEAEADASLVDQIASIRDVSFIQEDAPRQTHMDLIQSNTYMGHDTPQSFGYTGSGVLAEVQDNGIDRDHPQLANVIYTDGSVVADDHGTCTSGIMFADGTGDMQARGIAYEAVGAFADWNTGRATSISNLWAGDFNEGSAGMNGVVQSNSWSQGSLDGTYTSYSTEDDQAVVDNPKVLVLYAAGNGNDGTSEGLVTQDCVAKNVMAIGAIFHKDTADMSDDEWIEQSWGNTPSRGPAADGRQKVDMCAAFDWIYTTDMLGSSGYTTGDYYDDFGGTSGATPTVAGSAVLLYDMYQDDFFGNNPSGDWPYSNTIKAMLIADAYQYDLADATRNEQGWGTPDMEYTYNLGMDYHQIHENPQALDGGDSWSDKIYSDGFNPLKITLTWIDPAASGSTGSSRALINNLDLKVTSPTGTEYYGNNGLWSSLWSSSGTGTNHWSQSSDHTDDLNNVENVFVQNPESGLWTIEVSGVSGDVADGPQDFSVVASGAKVPITSAGEIILDQDAYAVEDVVSIDVMDSDLNTNPSAIEMVIVDIDSNSEPTGESVTLTETAVDSSTFRGTIPISASDSSGVLQVTDGDTITAAYDDADNGSGPVTVTDTAMVDGTPPTQISDLGVFWYGFSSGTIFTDDVESGNQGFTTGGDESWAIRTLGANSGSSSWDFGNGDYNDPSSGGLGWLLSPAIDLTSANTAELTFWHWRDFESDSTLWDGGNVKISTTGTGGPFTIITGTPSYDGLASSGYDNPLAGESVYGYSSGWESVTMDLSDYVGNTVHIRWEAGVDNYGTSDAGWRVDDIEVTAMIPGQTDDNLVNWSLSADDGGGTDDVAQYNIYRASQQTGPWDGAAYIGNVSAGTDSYLDAGRGEFDGTSWWYVVRAEDVLGNEEQNSNAVPEPGAAIPPSVMVLDPNSGPTLDANSYYYINWTVTLGTNSLKSNPITIEFSSNSGGDWTIVASNEANDGSYQWLVPDISSTTCLIRVWVEDDSGLNASDVSDLEFIIISGPTQPPEVPLDLSVQTNGFLLSWGLGGATEVDNYYVFNTSTAYDFNFQTIVGDVDLGLGIRKLPGSVLNWSESEANLTGINTMYYLVRAWNSQGFSSNSTMLVWHRFDFSYNSGLKNNNYIGLPYNWTAISPYPGTTLASDIVTSIEGGTGGGANQYLSIVGKWNPAIQGTDNYYYSTFPVPGWTGTDFTVNPGDGINLVLSNTAGTFTWETAGTDFNTTQAFSYNTGLKNNNYIGCAWSTDLATASDIVTTIEGGTGGGTNTKLTIVGKWNPAIQGTDNYYYSTFPVPGWTGNDFAVEPGNGINLVLSNTAGDFTWDTKVQTNPRPETSYTE